MASPSRGDLERPSSISLCFTRPLTLLLAVLSKLSLVVGKLLFHCLSILLYGPAYSGNVVTEAEVFHGCMRALASVL